MLKGEGQGRADNLSHADLEVPQTRPARLLRLGPPHAGDEDEGRGDRGLEDTQEHPHDHEGRVRLASRVACDQDSPADHVDRQVLADGEALHEVGRDGLGDDVADVEDGSQVVVLVALEVVLDAHDGGIVEERLVQVL